MPSWVKPLLDLILRLSPAVSGTVYVWLQSNQWFMTIVVFLVSLLATFITPPGAKKPE